MLTHSPVFFEGWALADTKLNSDIRVRVFLDYWNFVLSRKCWEERPQLDWSKFGPWLANNAGALGLDQKDCGRIRYEGMHVYASYNPAGGVGERRFKNWALNTLDRFSGVQVVLKERKPKHPPKCPVCHEKVITCPVPTCAESMIGTVEKGIDTAIVTDMIKLAWEDSYDVAVLVSADRDFIPAVELLDAKGRRVIHAGFSPEGRDLARKSWASFDLGAIMCDELRRS